MIFTLFQDPLLFFAWLVAFLIALTVHEFSHALAANWLGDQTAERMGRLTLNPLAHLDPLGFLMVFLIGFGWGRPVPFNPNNLKWPKWGPVWVAAAGPASNLILAVIAAVVYGAAEPALGDANLLVTFLLVFAELNIALLAFNLIPLPPLDGSKALLAILSAPRFAQARRFLEIQGPIILIALIVIDSVANLGLFASVFNAASNIVAGIASVIRL